MEGKRKLIAVKIELDKDKVEREKMVIGILA